MPRPTRALTAVTLALFALACVCLAALAPVPRRASAQTQGGSLNMNAAHAAKEEPRVTVSGRAVYDDTARPVRRAHVTLLAYDGRQKEYNALTDARGEFRITGVMPGSYFAFTDVPGVISPVSFISVDMLGRGTPDFSGMVSYFDTVEVDGAEDRQLTVHARRGAVIAGRVSYSDGDPAVNVAINVMRRDGNHLTRYFAGGSLLMNALRTDDRGMYRLAGLPPGEYVIGVSESVVHSSDSRTSPNDDTYLSRSPVQQLLMTFYPSATEAKDATAIKVAAGDEHSDIDITIPERGLHTVEGLVRGGPDKKLIEGAQVVIARKNDESGAGADASAGSTTTDEQGRWQFTEIPDGQYAITVTPPASDAAPEAYQNMSANVTVTNANVTVTNMNTSGPRRRKSYAPARRDVQVEGADVSEIAVELGAGASVSGTITVEGGKRLQYGYVVLSRLPDAGDPPGSNYSDSARDYGTSDFVVEGLPPGRYRLEPAMYIRDEANDEVYIKSITWNGKDLTREPLELGEGQAVSGVQVVFAHNPASLVVGVVGGDKRPVFGARVFLVPADAGGVQSPFAREPSCSTEDGGSCSVKAPPGDYRVVVLTLKDAAALRGSAAAVEAEVMRRAATAASVSLRAGESKEVGVVATGN
jgi:protocatechuate 3,4-dioxygenase beta subunit